MDDYYRKLQQRLKLKKSNLQTPTQTHGGINIDSKHINLSLITRQQLEKTFVKLQSRCQQQQAEITNLRERIELIEYQCKYDEGQRIIKVLGGTSSQKSPLTTSVSHGQTLNSDRQIQKDSMLEGTEGLDIKRGNTRGKRQNHIHPQKLQQPGKKTRRIKKTPS